MRKIIKQTEPREWTEYRSTSGVDYEAIPELRKSLLEEQGYICAYCMRRIPVKDKDSNEESRIDHLLSRKRHPDPEHKLGYTNMVICCPGAINSDFHCDKQKGENDLSFDLFNDHFFTTLSYKSKTGQIESSDVAYNGQMNNLLNLNNRLLMHNRQSALLGVISMLNRIGWTVTNITRQINQWDNQDTKGQYKEYNGIILWYLTKKLKQQCKR